LAKILGEKSADEAAEQITGLEKSHPLYPKIAETIKKVQAAKKYIRDS
jgi:mannitol-1-phosphate 5-dehydrogenase